MNLKYAADGDTIGYLGSDQLGTTNNMLQQV